MEAVIWSLQPEGGTRIAQSYRRALRQNGPRPLNQTGENGAAAGVCERFIR
jgi:hypothetical protein